MSENKASYSPIDRKDSDSLRMGNIEISDNVIAAIAAQAAQKIDGIRVVASSFHLFGKDNARGVAVKTDMDSGHVEINVDVNVRYGVTIYDACHDLQRLIKEEVEALTGSMNVDKVNIRVKHLLAAEDEEGEGRPLLTPDQAYSGEETIEE